jgi:hypothetical protein
MPIYHEPNRKGGPREPAPAPHCLVTWRTPTRRPTSPLMRRARRECRSRGYALTSRWMSARFGRPSERCRVRIGVAIAADASDRTHALLPAAERARMSRAHVPAILGTPRPIGRRVCGVWFDRHYCCECQQGEDHSCHYGLLLLGTRIPPLGRVRSGSTVDRPSHGRQYSQLRRLGAASTLGGKHSQNDR